MPLSKALSLDRQMDKKKDRQKRQEVMPKESLKTVDWKGAMLTIGSYPRTNENITHTLPEKTGLLGASSELFDR